MISGSDYGPGLETAPSFPECDEHCSIRSSLNPAHETYDDDLGKVLDTKYYKKLGVGIEKFTLGKNFSLLFAILGIYNFEFRLNKHNWHVPL